MRRKALRNLPSGSRLQVLTDTRQLVATTVMNAVDTAKDAVASRVAGAVDLTKHVVQDSVELTKSVVSSTVNTALDAATGTKDTVTSKVNAAVGQGREAIQDGVEMTSFMVNSSINTAKAVGNVVASGVDAVLWKSEELVDHYLPVTEEELGEKVLSCSQTQLPLFPTQAQILLHLPAQSLLLAWGRKAVLHFSPRWFSLNPELP